MDILCGEIVLANVQMSDGGDDGEWQNVFKFDVGIGTICISSYVRKFSLDGSSEVNLAMSEAVLILLSFS